MTARETPPSPSVAKSAGAGATVTPIRPDQRPLIRTGPAIHEQGDAAVSALAADPNLYQQGGHLVRVVRVDPSEATPQKPDGTPEVIRVASETLRVQLSRFARWERYDSRAEAWIACAPPKDIATEIVKRREYCGIRPLDAVTETPALRPDGTILDRPGYDARTRVLYLPSVSFDRVRDDPTQAHAAKAMAELLKPYREFPFERDEQRYVPVAALLTLFARPAILGCVPAFGFDASAPGSGKSLITQVISAVFTGRWSEPNTYPVDPVELEKSLGGEAMSGAPIIDFDNIEDILESGPLLKVITAKDKVRLRIMGSNTKASLRFRAVMLLGGNNLVIGRQMSRRMLVARLEPQDERPEERTGFKIPKLGQWALDNRARQVAAALTVLRAYFAEGRPPQDMKPLGSFEEWSDVVPAAIRFAGGPDVTLCRAAAGPGADDTTTAALRVIVGHWGRLCASLAAPHGLAVSAALKVLYPEGRRPKGDAPPDGYDALREAIEELVPGKGGFAPSPKAIGEAFGKLRTRWVSGKQLKDSGVTDGSKRWIVLTQEKGTKGS